MSLHIEAGPGEIADTVLITGDPLRAKHFAETSLTNPFCFNTIRAMYGYTGTYNGTRISIMGTGIGMPSTALYLHELIHAYAVKTIIRLGTCGAIQSNIALGQIIAADKSLTDSNAVAMVSPTPLQSSKILLDVTKAIATRLGYPMLTGSIFSTDLFYRDDDATRWQEQSSEGVLAVDMETAILYAMGAKYNIPCASILTVSDNILTGAITPAKDRETKTSAMLTLVLEVAIANR